MNAGDVETTFGRNTRLSYTQASTTDNDLATQQTVTLMGSAIRAAANSPEVVAAVKASGANGRRLRKASAVWAWVKHNIRFESDDLVLRTVLGMPDELELLIEPRRLLTMPTPMGDCDDFSMLAGAMLLTLGVPIEIVTIAADPDDENRFSHVYLQAQLEDGRRIVLDCSHGLHLGWEAPHLFRRQVWTLEGKPVSAAKPIHVPASRLNGLGDWSDTLQNIATTVSKSATSIWEAKAGVYAPGTQVIQRDGTRIYSRDPYTYNVPVDEQGNLINRTGMSPINPTWLLVGGFGLIALLVVAGGRR